MASATQVAYHRTRWAQALDKSCVVTHTPYSSDGAGGQVVGSPTTTTYACKVQPSMRDPRERPVGGVVTAVSEWEIGLPYNAVIVAADTITESGTVYQVDDTTTGRSNNYGLLAYCTKLGTA